MVKKLCYSIAIAIVGGVVAAFVFIGSPAVSDAIIFVVGVWLIRILFAMRRLPGQRIAKIEVLLDGRIILDGVPASLSAVEDRLVSIARISGSVWYYREQADLGQSESGQRIMHLALKHQIPVSMSSRPDFSDYVDDQGIVRERH